MKVSQQSVLTFQKKILKWYKKNKRDLPWREIPDGISLEQRAYWIFISEVMLQQTQVSRVIPKYEAWLKVFPTIEKLAQAKTSDILRLWSGLGYNRRALYLQKTAKTVVHEYGTVWPKTVEALKKLPGIGEYTARAVACFAFHQQVAVVDTNVRRVILTQFQISPPKADQPLVENVKSQRLNEKQIQIIADQLLPYGKAYDWNQALMDYSSALLKKEKVQLTKQSKFQGSNRYYRGKLMKLLVQKNQIKEQTVESFLYDEHMTDKVDLNMILNKLEREGFIERKKGIIKLVK